MKPSEQISMMQNTIRRLMNEVDEWKQRAERAETQYRRLEIQYSNLLFTGLTERDIDDGK